MAIRFDIDSQRQPLMTHAITDTRAEPLDIVKAIFLYPPSITE
jgi:hypothetical protein